MKRYKDELDRSKISNVTLLFTTALSLVAGLITILYEPEKFNERSGAFAVILLVCTVCIMGAYILLLIRRVNPKQFIYVSYSSADDEIANKIIAKLSIQLTEMSKFRFEVLSADAIPYGADMSTTMQNFLTKSSIIIIIVSENYITSKWCNEEFIQLSSLDKKIIPIVIGSYDQLADLPKDISNIKALAIRENMQPKEIDQQIRLLARDLVRQRTD